jgi:DNA (cytosine-5)-methyltransferase 1
VRIVDLFAGPGGWDLAAHAHGLDPLGIELDGSACATRDAAGLRTLQADVADLDPLDFAPCAGLIGSPPCQAFSMAGKGAGRGAIDAYVRAIGQMERGQQIDAAALDEACGDPRGHLVLEPLRWALALRPRWIALEQVPPVLPLWEAMGNALRGHGYSVWTGDVSAECYGVPQTRKRAILLASVDGRMDRPRATHQRYLPARSRDDEGGGMFDLPEAGRVVAPEDTGLLPWVSMAQALGWQEGPSPSPSPSVTGGGGATGGVEVFASKAARARAAGAVIQTNNFTAVQRDPDGRRSKNGSIAYTRPVDDPAPTLGGRVDLWEVLRPTHLRAGTNANDASRAADEPAPTPAPTITGGHDHNERAWVTHYDRRQSPSAGVVLRPRGEPAPTLCASKLAKDVDVWVGERPATTVAGDPRVHPPGHKVNAEDIAAGRDGYDGRAGENAVRVSLAEALILQSFPPDYPVQGTKTKQFEQVGNAVPPLLAWHVLAAVALIGAEEIAA